ncbi:auxin-responsive protein IAA25-like isoform X1 [Typha angustifolia]|uniref:auxin-responsive protein IAA25-like isoform X1 n=1 Tax=Typha angustifolia TaxID=59011 RepID=UPI003C2D5AB0
MKSALLELQLKDEELGDGLDEYRDKKAESCVQKHLELRLGMSSDTVFEGSEGPRTRLSTPQDGIVIQNKDGPTIGGAKRCFSETGIHPWNLASRQQKVVLEQAHQTPNSCRVSRARHPPPPVVGWPPIRTFRRNLGSPHLSKPTNSEQEAEMTKLVDMNNESKIITSPTMFVKVNIEGCAVGRKIDLKAYDSYDSLSYVLQKMFHNFLSHDVVKNSNQDDQVETIPSNYILIYEDNEGDRMLVGDVPWELFITSVRRLYITQDPRAQHCGSSFCNADHTGNMERIC